MPMGCWAAAPPIRAAAILKRPSRQHRKNKRGRRHPQAANNGQRDSSATVTPTLHGWVVAETKLRNSARKETTRDRRRAFSCGALANSKLLMLEGRRRLRPRQSLLMRNVAR